MKLVLGVFLMSSSFLSATTAQSISTTSGAPATPFGPGRILDYQKISDMQGGFDGDLDDGDFFGVESTPLGDFDGDGVLDVAVSAYGDGDGGFRRGAVWMLFLKGDGTVKAHQKISDTEGGFTGILDNSDLFGEGLAYLGDLDTTDEEDIPVLAVGAAADDDGSSNCSMAALCNPGAVWLLKLNPVVGTVQSHQKISDTEGNFPGELDDGDSFGISVAALGDLDGDGVGDLAVGAFHDDDGGTPPDANRGAVWILFLNGDGTVKSHHKISDATTAGLGLSDSDQMAYSLAHLGDLDGPSGESVTAIAAGGNQAGMGPGVVWILFLESDGTVLSHQRISDGEGGLPLGALEHGTNFGISVGSLGDVDGDGVTDLAVGAPVDDAGGRNQGAAWILFLQTDGTVRAFLRVSDIEGGFGGHLDPNDAFGQSVNGLGDLDGNGSTELVVGAFNDDDGGVASSNRGAVWTLFLENLPTPATASVRTGRGDKHIAYQPSTRPIRGKTWVATVRPPDGSELMASVVFGFADPADRLQTPLGELLVDPLSQRIAWDFVYATGPVNTHQLTLSNEPSLSKRTVHTQAFAVTDSGVWLTNAVDLVLGDF